MALKEFTRSTRVRREPVEHGATARERPSPRTRRGVVVRPGITGTPRYARPALERARYMPQPVAHRLVGAAGATALRIGLGIGLALEAGEMVDNLLRLPAPVPNPANGWELIAECPTWAVKGINSWTSFTAYPGAATRATFNSCLDGQASGPPNFPVTPLSGTTNGLGFRHTVQNSSGSWRAQNQRLYGRPDVGVQKLPPAHTHTYAEGIPMIGAQSNPNAMRRSPEAARSEPFPMRTGPKPAPDSWGWSSDGTPPAEPTSSRPEKGTREQKQRSRANRVGTFLWGLMDVASEYTEILDAMYDALPAKDRARWACAKGIGIGQYGSEMNTCKGKALFHNWHKMDGPTAFMNIAKMVTEDMTIGAFHKFLSRLYPPGFSIQRTAVTHLSSKAEVEAYIAKRLKELFKYLGLE